ncbi:MAG TPA: hypothetical protein VMZ31_02890 [Phycisphaerae bacterium]|nr:hypothetical protein [Phycisphaerae bacterium]
MSIRFACPVCGRELTFADDLKGATRPCPQCGADLLVWPVDRADHDATPAPTESPAPLGQRVPQIIVPTHVEYRPARGGRRWFLWSGAAVAVIAVLVVFLVYGPRGERSNLPSSVSQRARAQAEARLAGLDAATALDYLLEGGGVPPGLPVKVAGVLDERVLVIESQRSSGRGAGPGRIGVYALLISARDPAIEAHGQFRNQARMMLRRLGVSEEYSPTAFSEQWDALRQLQGQTMPGKALVVLLDPLKHPGLYRQNLRPEATRAIGPLQIRDTFELLPASEPVLMWQGSRQLDRCKGVLGQVASASPGFGQTEMTIESIPFRGHVAAAFAGSELAANLQIVEMFRQK